MKLSQRILLLETLIAMYLFIQMLFPTHFSLTKSVTGFSILTIIKYNFEGFRLNFFLFIFAQLLALTPYPALFYIPGLVCTALALIYFPVYRYPEPSGDFKVGYRSFKLNGKIHAAIYYPTNEITEDIRYTHNVDGWGRFAEIIMFYAKVRGNRHPPKLFYKLMLSILDHQYLGVNLNAKVAQTSRTEGFPIILFSHGLAANMHEYSAQIKEWASHGYIVISIDHDEQITMNIRSVSEYSAYVGMRSVQLLEREKILSQLLDYASDNKNISSLLEESNILIDYKSLILAGHSFGGATACEVAAQDKRVTGGLVLLDPWLEPCSQKIYNSPIDKPILMIRSDSFDKIQSIKDNSMKFVKATDQGKGRLISGYFKGSTHLYSTDLQIHCPREMVIFKKLRSMDDLVDNLDGTAALTQLFLDTIVESKEKSAMVKGAENVKDVVLKKYKDYLKMNFRENKFETDE